MGFFDPVVAVPKPTWRRLSMLINEVSYMQDGEELSGLDLDHECERFVVSIVDEYVRQYFEESTRAAAELVTRQHKERGRKLLEY